jgi:hypothetical protein
VPIWTRESIRLGAELPQISRQWNLRLFTERHEVIYGSGAGHIVKEAWPERNIHSDAAAAEREGLPAPVASAPQIFSMLHRMMLASFGAGWVAGGKMSVKMIKPVYPEDFTTGKGRVTSLSLEAQADGQPARVRAHCDMWVERRDGTQVMVGTASALLS